MSTLVCASFLSSMARAAGPSVSLQGRILQSNGRALENSSVEFRVRVLSTDSNGCTLYEETQTRNMTASGGLFTVSLNDGTGTRSDGLSHSFEDAFSNRTTLLVPAAKCLSGTGTVSVPFAANDERNVTLSFRPGGSTTWETVPAMTMTHSSFALEARKVGGYAPTSLLRVDSPAAGTIPALTSAQHIELQAIIGGTSTQYSRNAANGVPVMPSYPGSNPSSPQSGQIWFDSTSNSLRYYNGSQAVTLGAAGAGISSLTVGANLTADGTPGGVLSGPGVIDLADTGVTAGTYAKVRVDAKGRVLSGAALTQSDIPTLSNAGLVVGSAITSGTIGGSTSMNVTGPIVTTGTVTAAAVASTTLSGRSIAVYDAGNTNYTTITAAAGMTGNLSMVLPATAGSSGQILRTDGAGNLSWTTPASSSAPSGAATGDLAGTYPSPSVAAIRGVAVGTSAPTLAGQVLKYDGASQYSAGSINLSDLRSTVSGALFASPACSGAQTLSWSSLNDNFTCVSIAGLDAGSVTTGTFAVARIPNLDWSKITSGKPTTLAGYGVTDGVLNAGGAPSLSTGLDGAYPSSPADGAIFVASDTRRIYRYASGTTTWVLIASNTGSGGTVTNVTAGSGLLGGTITSAGTIALDASGVTAGSYGSTSTIPVFSVDAYGRVTSAGTVALLGAAPTGSAGGDLTGTYPNPTLTTTGVSAGTYAKVGVDTKGRVIASSTLAATDLPASGVTAGTYGGATWVPQFSVDAYGRVTTAGSVTITGAAPTGAAGGDLTGSFPNPTLTTTGVSAGTYAKVGVDTKGRVISSSTLAATDLPASGVAAGSYGSTSSIPIFNVDAYGRLTSAGTVAILGAAPTGSAGGDLTGSYPNPTLTTTGVSAGTYTKVGVDTKGRVIASSTLAATDLPASGVTAGTYGGATWVPQFSVDAYGRVTTAGSVTITGAAPTGSAGGDLTGTYPNPTLSTTGVLAGTYTKVTVDTKGRVTSASVLTSSDLPASGVTAGSYGSSGYFPFFNVDAYGRLTSAGSFAITGASPVGSSLTAGNIWVGSSGNLAASVAMSGDATLASTGSLTLASTGVAAGTYIKTGVDAKGRVVSGSTLSATDLPASGVTAGTYGGATWVPQFSVDTYGRVVTAGSVTITGAAPTGSAGGDLTGTYPNPTLTTTGVSAGTYAKVGVDTKGRVISSSTLAAMDLPASGVTAGSYGSTSSIPIFNVDAYGRLTSAGTVAILGAAPTGSAGGDLTGTYPNPTLTTTGVSAGTYAKVGVDTKGRVIASSTLAATDLPASGVTAGTYGGATWVPQFSVDAYGRVTTAGSVTITGAAPTGSAGGDLTGTYPNPTLTTTGVLAGTYTKVTVDTKGRVTSATVLTSADLPASGVTAGSYGSSGYFPFFNVDAYGRLTSAGSFAITGASPVGSSLTAGNIWVGSAGNLAAAVAMSGDATLASTGSLTLASTGVAAGTYAKVRVDTKGRVIASSTLAAADLPASGVTAGTYGGATWVPQFSVDTYGRVITAGSVTITGAAPTGSAGGDLTGTYPNPTLTTTGVSAGTYAKVGVDTKGRVISSSTLAATDLPASGVTAGTYGGATWVPQFSVDAYGRVTTAGSVTIAGAAPTGSAGGDLTGSYPNPTLSTTGVLAGTYTKVIVDTKGRVTSATVLDSSDLPSSGVTAGSYGSSGFFPFFNVDAYGRVTSAGSYALPAAVAAAAGSTGSVQFNSSGTLAASIALNWDNVNNRLGIGVTSPVQPLSIATSGTNSGIRIQGTNRFTQLSTNAAAGAFNSITQAGDQMLIYGGTAADTGTPNLVIAPWSASTSGLRMDGSGNIGIGTTSGFNRLAVASNVNQLALLDSNSTNTTTTGGSMFSSNDGLFFIQGTNASGAGSAVRFTIDQVNGFVGIGTTAPGSALEVNGTMRLSGSTAGYLGLRAPATAGSVTWTMPATDGTANQALITTGAGSLGWASMGGGGTVTNVGLSMPSVFSVTPSTVTTAGTFAVTLATQTQNQIFAGPASGGAVAPTFRSLVAADLPAVGAATGTFGTSTSPAIPFFTTDATGRVVSAGTLAVAAGSRQAISVSAGVMTISAGTTGVTSGSYGNASFIPWFNVDAYGNIVAAGSVAMPVSAGSTQWVTSGTNISYSAGSVGIGIANPWNQFQIYRDNNNAQADIISDNTSSSTARYPNMSIINYMGSPANGAGGNPFFRLVNLRGNSSTSAPMQTGEQLGGFSFNGSHNTAGGYREGAAIQVRTAEAFSASAAGSNLYLMTTSLGSTAPTEKLTVLASGNVGVGTMTPTAKLEVSGGQAVVSEFVTTGTLINFNNGNNQAITTVSGGTIALSNMVPGGVYNLYIDDTTVRTYDFTGCGTAYWSPARAATTASSRSVYTIYRRGASACYITWMSGFQ